MSMSSPSGLACLRRRPSRRAFTLVELMIGVAVFAVVGGMLYFILNLGLVLFSKNISVNQIHATARTSVDQLGLDLFNSIDDPTMASVPTTLGTSLPPILTAARYYKGNFDPSGVAPTPTPPGASGTGIRARNLGTVQRARAGLVVYCPMILPPKTLVITLALVLAGRGCEVAVDFSPRYADILADGVAQHSLYLQNGPLKAFLRLPPQWEIKGEAGALCLTSPQHGSARVDIRSSAVPLPAAPDEKWIKLMTPQLLKSLPAGAEKGAVLETKANPIQILSWKSFEFVLSYEIAGNKFLRSVCFITLHNQDNAEMVTGGGGSDFGPARAAGFSLLTSWLEPPARVTQRMMQ